MRGIGIGSQLVPISEPNISISHDAFYCQCSIIWFMVVCKRKKEKER